MRGYGGGRRGVVVVVGGHLVDDRGAQGLVDEGHKKSRNAIATWKFCTDLYLSRRMFRTPFLSRRYASIRYRGTFLAAWGGV